MYSGPTQTGLRNSHGGDSHDDELERARREITGAASHLDYIFANTAKSYLASASPTYEHQPTSSIPIRLSNPQVPPSSHHHSVLQHQESVAPRHPHSQSARILSDIHSLGPSHVDTGINRPVTDDQYLRLASTPLSQQPFHRSPDGTVVVTEGSMPI